MGDPLSAASAIISIVSLGLDVSNGIIRYYVAWKMYDEDVAATDTALTQLHAKLQLLKNVLESKTIQGYAAANEIHQCISHCQGGILKLKKLLDKIRAKGPTLQDMDKKTDFLTKLGDQGRRLLYPFRQGTLGKLRDAVGELMNDVTPALHILQM